MQNTEPRLTEENQRSARWRENLVATLIFLALLGLLILSVGSGTPFVYGKF